MKKNDFLKKTPVLFYVFVFCLFASFTNKVNKKSYIYYFDGIGDYVSLTVTGFNEDVVAETGNLSGASTASVDKASDDFCFITNNVGISYGLPLDGALSNGNISYQLADYTSNNSLRLIGASNTMAVPEGAEEGNPTSGSITFTENESLEAIYLAVTSGSGSSPFSGTVVFDDSSTQAFSLVAPDWYAGGTVIANNLGRGRRSDNSLSGAPSGGPYIFQLSISIDLTNQSKTVTGINFQNDTLGDEVFNLFAVSGKIVPNCDAPTNLSADTTPTTATLSWFDDIASSWEIVVQDVDSGLPSGNGETVTATTYNAVNNIGTVREFYVRALCSDNINFSPWTGPFVYGSYYMPLSVSGLNADVIANGVGDALVSAPQDIDGTGYAYLSEDYKLTETDSDLGYGLPVDGLINSSYIDGLKYEFSSYSSNNSLRIEDVGVEETLVVANAYPAEKIFFLTTSGSGEGFISGTINFNDGSNQIFSSINIPDWYYSNSLPVVISGIGRISVADNVIQNPFNNPRIYELEIDIEEANQTKTITSINISKDSGGVVNLFALSMRFSDSNLSVETFDDVYVSVYPNPVKGKLYIKSVNISNIVMYNILGKEITVDYNDSVVNMSSLDDGIYLVKIFNHLGKSKTFKVIKN